MGKCLLLKAGGGSADLDGVTAATGDVLMGKVTVDREGEPVTGTMPNNPAQNATLNCGQSKSIPAGYTPGGTITANSLASQTGGNAVPGDILAGKTAWVNGNRVTGNIPLQNTDVPSSDRAYATGITCWAGTVNLGVRNRHLLNGVNWIQGNIPNLTAANIKKGVNIGGLAGTHSGFVAEPTDLYINGNNVVGFQPVRESTGDVWATFESGQISPGSYITDQISIYANLNLLGYSTLTIQVFHLKSKPSGNSTRAYLYEGTAPNGGSIAQYYSTAVVQSNTFATYPIDIRGVQISKIMRIRMEGSQRYGEMIGASIRRIWLS